MMNKYIYKTCEHHINCGWTKPKDEADDINANYVKHIVDTLAEQKDIKVGFK